MLDCFRVFSKNEENWYLKKANIIEQEQIKVA